MLSRFRRIAGLPAIYALSACSSNFPGGDIADAIRNRTGYLPVRNAAGYSVYGGYGSACAHPGAHFTFNPGGSYQVFAALDGVVSDFQQCLTNGTNDTYSITVAVGVRGAVPVYLEYDFEPFGGKKCSGATDPEDYFRAAIAASVGKKVAKGDQIAEFDPLGTGAHIHIDLKADGATICPEIFPASAFTDPTLNLGPLSPATCGSAAIPANTMCFGLTAGEDPSVLTR